MGPKPPGWGSTHVGTPELSGLGPDYQKEAQSMLTHPNHLNWAQITKMGLKPRGHTQTTDIGSKLPRSGRSRVGIPEPPISGPNNQDRAQTT
uniref:Uncharacterized protein n=1 Tax=Ditylenchus dipsaci TaxID=166011 RepID=A0A915DDW5_9BILA